MNKPRYGRYELIDYEGYIVHQYWNKYLIDEHFECVDNKYFVYINEIVQNGTRYHGRIGEQDKSIIGNSEWKYFKACKPYKEDTTKQEIIDDGWSRDFSLEQTSDELRIMGHDVSDEYIISEWDKWDDSINKNYPEDCHRFHRGSNKR